MKKREGGGNMFTKNVVITVYGFMDSYIEFLMVMSPFMKNKIRSLWNAVVKMRKNAVAVYGR